jgi:hypothetical protein
MKTMLQTAIVWSCFMLLAYAASKTVTPISVSQTGYFSDAEGNAYLLTSTGSTATVVKVLITSDAGVTPVARKFLVVVSGTPKQAEKYLEAQGASQ